MPKTNNNRKQRDDQFMHEQARLWLMLGVVCIGLLFVFSLGDWGWLTR